MADVGGHQSPLSQNTGHQLELPRRFAKTLNSPTNYAHVRSRLAGTRDVTALLVALTRISSHQLHFSVQLRLLLIQLAEQQNHKFLWPNSYLSFYRIFSAFSDYTMPRPPRPKSAKRRLADDDDSDEPAVYTKKSKTDHAEALSEGKDAEGGVYWEVGFSMEAVGGYLANDA